MNPIDITKPPGFYAYRHSLTNPMPYKPYAVFQYPPQAEAPYPYFSVTHGGQTIYHNADGTAPNTAYDLIESRPEPREWDAWCDGSSLSNLNPGDSFPAREKIRVREILPEQPDLTALHEKGREAWKNISDATSWVEEQRSDAKPLTLEAGKFYLNRKGEKIGPLAFGQDGSFRDPEWSRYYWPDGAWVSKAGREPHELDLVSLAPDEPHSKTVTETFGKRLGADGPKLEPSDPEESAARDVLERYSQGIAEKRRENAGKPYVTSETSTRFKKIEEPSPVAGNPVTDPEWRELGPEDLEEVISRDHEVAYGDGDDPGWISPTGSVGKTYGEQLADDNGYRARRRVGPEPVRDDLYQESLQITKESLAWILSATKLDNTPNTIMTAIYQKANETFALLLNLQVKGRGE